LTRFSLVQAEKRLKHTPGKLELQDLILYEDKAIIAINKPAGLRTIVDGYDPALPHLAGLLREEFGAIWVVHRLDKETSGIVLFAHTPEAHQQLNLQFRTREMRKEYHALVLGLADWQKRSISLALKVDGDRSHRTVVNETAGKPAETDLEVLQLFQSISYLAVLPHSGYTHQIRTHLAAIGLPILHDPLYKSRQPETSAQNQARDLLPSLPIQRLALHASQITFRHPQSGVTQSISAPEPADFIQTIQYLSR
jgi:tRNA pseudouridine32 synthase / 23S rRNA pseudouridine746 synthase